MKFWKIVFVISTCLSCSCLLCACGHEKKIVVNKPTSSKVPSRDEIKNSGLILEPSDESEEDGITKEKEVLNSGKASVYINYVGSKYTEFWSCIESNGIDAAYNSVKIPQNNIRLYDKANLAYYESWEKEVNASYNELYELLDDENKEYLKKVKESFDLYMQGMETLCDILFIQQNEYGISVNSHIRRGHSFLMANKERQFAIELKEYIFLLTQKVSFSSDQEWDIEEKDSYKKSETLHTEFVQDQIFSDIMNDYLKMKRESLGGFRADSEINREKANDYQVFWFTTSSKAANRLKGYLIKTDKKSFSNQEENFVNYVIYTSKLQNFIFEKSEGYGDRTGEIKSDIDFYKGEKFSKHFFEVMEFLYILSGNIEIQD